MWRLSLISRSVTYLEIEFCSYLNSMNYQSFATPFLTSSMEIWNAIFTTGKVRVTRFYPYRVISCDSNNRFTRCDALSRFHESPWTGAIHNMHLQPETNRRCCSSLSSRLWFRLPDESPSGFEPSHLRLHEHRTTQATRLHAKRQQHQLETRNRNLPQKHRCLDLPLK